MSTTPAIPTADDSLPINVSTSWLRAVSRRLEAPVYLHPLSGSDEHGAYVEWLMVPGKTQEEAGLTGYRRYVDGTDGLTVFRGREQVMARIDLMPRTEDEARGMPTPELMTVMRMRGWLEQRERKLTPWEGLQDTLKYVERELNRRLATMNPGDRLPLRGWVMVKPPNGPTGYAMELPPPLPSPDGRPWRFVAAETQADAHRIWQGMDREARAAAAILDPTLYEIAPRETRHALTPAEGQALVENATALREAGFQNLGAIEYAEESLRLIFEARKLPLAPQEHLWVPVSTKAGYAAPFLEGYAQWDGEVWNVVEASSQGGAQARVRDGELTVHTHVRIAKLCEGWEVLPHRTHGRTVSIPTTHTRDELKAILAALTIEGGISPDRAARLGQRVAGELQQRDKYETAKGWVRATKEERDGEPQAGYMVPIDRNHTLRWYFVEAETPAAAQQLWETLTASERREAEVLHAIWYRLQPSNAADMQTLTESDLRAFVDNRDALNRASFSGLSVITLAEQELTRRAMPAPEPEQLPLKIETARPVLEVERWCPVVCSLGNRFLQQAPDGSWTQGMDRTQSMAQHLYEAEGEANWCVRNVDPKEYEFRPVSAEDARTLTEGELRAVLLTDIHHTERARAVARREMIRRDMERQAAQETKREETKVTHWCVTGELKGVVGGLRWYVQRAASGKWVMGQGCNQVQADINYRDFGTVTHPDMSVYTFQPQSREQARLMEDDELKAVVYASLKLLRFRDANDITDAAVWAREELRRRREHNAEEHRQRQVDAEARLASPGIMDWPAGARPEDQPDLKTTLPLGTPAPAATDPDYHVPPRSGDAPAPDEDRPQATDTRGVKWDGKKARWSLIPWDAMSATLAVLESGARKYKEDNWLKVEGAQTRYWDAVMRHLTAWRMGERFDKEWGYPHLAHACCCILFLLAMELRGMFDPPTQPTPAEPDASTPEKAPGA